MTEIDDSVLEHPAHHFILGKTKSGKTTALIMFFEQIRKSKNKLFFPPKGQIIWVANLELVMGDKDKMVPNYMQFLMDKCKADSREDGGVFFPMIMMASNTLEDIKDELDSHIQRNYNQGLNTALVFDNLGVSTRQSNAFSQLMIQGRHSNVSIFNIVHSLFSHPALKLQRQQMAYIWFFFLKGTDAERFIEQNFHKSEREQVANLIEESTKNRFGYLLIDLDARPGELERHPKRFRDGYFIQPYTQDEMKAMIKMLTKKGKKR